VAPPVAAPPVACIPPVATSLPPDPLPPLPETMAPPVLLSPVFDWLQAPMAIPQIADTKIVRLRIILIGSAPRRCGIRLQPSEVDGSTSSWGRQLVIPGSQPPEDQEMVQVNDYSSRLSVSVQALEGSGTTAVVLPSYGLSGLLAS
jgi:hypothetical protein